MKKQSKKKYVALAEYAALMGRVAEYCAYERKCEAAEQAALRDALHGGEEKRPSNAELEKAKRELAQAGEPLDDYNVRRQVVRDRAEAAKPSAPSPDVSSIGLHLSMAKECVDDPFPKEWESLHNELVTADLPDRVFAEIERRHSELVALFPCADSDADAIEDAAQSFKGFLEAIAKPPTTPTPAGYTRNGISQEDFAKACGVTKKTVQNWENGKTKNVPVIFDATSKREVTYSAEVRDDCVFAKSFAMQWKAQGRLKRALTSPVEYVEGQTEQANERKRRGYSKSTAPRQADYGGETAKQHALRIRRKGEK